MLLSPVLRSDETVLFSFGKRGQPHDREVFQNFLNILSEIFRTIWFPSRNFRKFLQNFQTFLEMTEIFREKCSEISKAVALPKCKAFNGNFRKFRPEGNQMERKFSERMFRKF